MAKRGVVPVKWVGHTQGSCIAVLMCSLLFTAPEHTQRESKRCRVRMFISCFLVSVLVMASSVLTTVCVGMCRWCPFGIYHFG